MQFIVSFRIGTASVAETPKKRSKIKPTASNFAAVIDAKSYPEAIALCRKEHPHTKEMRVQAIVKR